MMQKAVSLRSLLTEKPSVALVGASSNPLKFGHIIFRDLLARGFPVYPVNPGGGEILDHSVFKSLTELSASEEPGLMVFVVPPAITLKVLKEAGELGWKNAWVQPGAGGKEVREYLEANGFTYLMDACIMV